jgi:tetratricopeptide (TPR) repeat protein
MRRIRLSVFMGFSLCWVLWGCQGKRPAGDDLQGISDSIARLIGPLESRLQQHPDSVGIRLELAGIWQEAGQSAKAIALVEEGIARDSTQSILWNRKASLELAGNDTLAVIRSLQNSLRSDPDQPVILLELGFIQAARQDSAALRIANDILNGKDDPALQSQARYLKGIYHANTGDTAAAIGDFDSCILNDYTFVDAYLEKGILLFDRMQYDAAINTFDKALTVQATNADAYYWKGRSLEAKGNKKEAVEHYRKALGLDESLTAAREALKKAGY